MSTLRVSDSKKFQPPKWCQAPKHPQTQRLAVCFVDETGASKPTGVTISTKAVYTIGRAETGVDVRLRGELGSRLHAAILQNVEGQKFLVDLRSTHGTFLNSRKLEPHAPVVWPPEARATFGSGSRADVLQFVPSTTVAEEGATSSVAESGMKFGTVSLDPVGELSRDTTAGWGSRDSFSVSGGESEGTDVVAVKRDRADIDNDCRRQAPKKPRHQDADDALAAFYGELPEAKVNHCAPRVEEKKRPEQILVQEEPTRVIFLDIDGVLRPVHGRTDFAQNVRTMLVNGSRVALMGGAEHTNDNLAGIDFWPSAMRALRHIAQKTLAAIVLSSDWRKAATLTEGVNNQLSEYGIPRLYGATPDLDSKNVAGVVKAIHSNVREKRAKEIRKWLRQHPRVERWVAIDDIDLSASKKDEQRHDTQGGSEPLPFLDPATNFVRCSPAVGLTTELAKLAVSFLNGVRLSPEELELVYSGGSADSAQMDPNFQGLGPTLLG
eukprot:TRINITY_DN8111_c0_g1_i1.p1 TRINITY_DN8111_c0_g1~~TRINITY_DN8111_c0_g1_i1.p1  ORF type:complete len:494 (-),score=65.47 TRINITY_DN8111_c0_g1_i1:201-1682(-)